MIPKAKLFITTAILHYRNTKYNTRTTYVTISSCSPPHFVKFAQFAQISFDHEKYKERNKTAFV